MGTQRIDGGAAVENITDKLNAHERLLRWQDDEEVIRWDLISGHPYFSPAGTEILQQRLGTNDAFVLDAGGHKLYAVVREEPRESETNVVKGRLREWRRDMPIQRYDRWRPEQAWFANEAVVEEHRPARTSNYALKRGTIIGGWAEIFRWMRNFPFESYRSLPTGMWYFRRVLDYYVWPNFREPMDATDVTLLIQDYPVTVSGELDVIRNTGHVFLRDPEEALAYPGRLKIAMADRGVECSPQVGITDLTDLPGSAEYWRGASASFSALAIPRPSDGEAEHILQLLRSLDTHLGISNRLRRSLEDEGLSNRRQAELERRVKAEIELVRAAEDGLKRWPRAKLYGLLARLLDERDMLAHEKKLLEIDVDVQTSRSYQRGD